ncbi:MAG: ATP synthase F1 subunit epsilon [Candidatus Buchananbacteria bacterium]
MAKIKFKIVVPEKIVYEKEIDQVTIPTELGQITVLPHHIPLVAIVQAGELVVKNGNEQEIMAVSGGFLEIKQNEVLVLTESAERAEEIDEARAIEAKERAQKLMSELKNKEEVEYTALASKIEKELARLRVAKKKKTYQPNITNQPPQAE